MTPIDLDVTRSVRAYMTSRLESGDFNLERVQQGLGDAACTLRAWMPAPVARVDAGKDAGGEAAPVA